MRSKNLLLLAMVLLLTACGPIIGQLMSASEGIKEFEVRSGRLEDLGGNRSLLIFAPFAKTDQAFFICKGEDEEHFAAEFNRVGLFKAEAYVERDARQVQQRREGLKEKSPEQLRQELGLERAPDLILTGTLLRRETTVAPSRGVVMDDSWRLEFYDPATRSSTVLEVVVRDLAEECIPELVKELARRLGRG